MVDKIGGYTDILERTAIMILRWMTCKTYGQEVNGITVEEFR